VNNQWNYDIFFRISVFLDQECAILELVCTQFAVYMSKDEFWGVLIALQESDSHDLNEKMKALVIDNKEEKQEDFFRSNYFSISFHWDEELHTKFLSAENEQHIAIRNKGKTLEEVSMQNSKWKSLACKEAVPNKEGRFWTFAIRIVKYSGTSTAYFGFGLMPTTDLNEYNGSKSTGPEGPFPYLWHMLDKRMGQDDLIVMAGMVIKGKQVAEFFLNGANMKPSKLYYNGNQDVYGNHPTADEDGPIHYHPHTAIVTSETFTIVSVNTLEYRAKYLQALETNDKGKYNNIRKYGPPFFAHEK